MTTENFRGEGNTPPTLDTYMSESPEAKAVRHEFRMRIRSVADEVLTDACVTFMAYLRERGLLVDVLSGALRDVTVDEWAATLTAHGAHARELLDQARADGVDSLFAELTGRHGQTDADLTAEALALIRERQAVLRDDAAADADVDAAPRVDPTQD